MTIGNVIRIAYDERNTYIAVEFSICSIHSGIKPHQLCVRHDNTMITPVMKTIRMRDLMIIIPFIDNWNSWNQIDMIQLRY